MYYDWRINIIKMNYDSTRQMVKNISSKYVMDIYN